jgi:hypothetical protein
MSAPPTWWTAQRDRWQALLVEYGNLAIGVYFALFLITLVGFYVAIGAGFEVSGVGAEVGRVGAAYAATKLSQPARIAATVVLTPALAAVRRRFALS